MKKCIALIIWMILICTTLFAGAESVPCDPAITAARAEFSRLFPDWSGLPDEASWQLGDTDEYGEECTEVCAVFRSDETDFCLSAVYNTETHQISEPFLQAWLPVPQEDGWGPELLSVWREWTEAAERDNALTEDEPYKSRYAPAAAELLLSRLTMLGLNPADFSCNADAVNTDGSMIILDGDNGILSVMMDFMDPAVREAAENDEDEIPFSAAPSFIISISAAPIGP